MIGSGVFLLFGVAPRRGAALVIGGDPVPQALVITGIVVAFSATALAVALLLRLHEATGSATLGAADDWSASIVGLCGGGVVAAIAGRAALLIHP